MCKRIFNSQTSSLGDIPFFKIGSFGKEADAFISYELYVDYKNKFSFPQKGDILISAAGTIGRTVIYDGGDAYYQDSNIVWIANDNTLVTNNFLYYILQIVKYNTEGGTIQRLYNNILKSTKFSTPLIAEQNKIAHFLSLLDERIATQSKIIEDLKVLKYALSKQIFSNLTIEITEKLGNICSITTGKLDANAMVDDGLFAFFTCAAEVYRINNYAFDTEALLISGNGANVGYIHYYKGKFNAYQRTYILDKFKANINYVHYYLQAMLPQRIEQEKNTGNTPYIVLGTLSDMNIELPKAEYQVDIANLLSSFDTKIDIENQILQKLEEQKKYFLANLFI